MSRILSLVPLLLLTATAMAEEVEPPVPEGSGATGGGPFFSADFTTLELHRGPGELGFCITEKQITEATLQVTEDGVTTMRGRLLGRNFEDRALTPEELAQVRLLVAAMPAPTCTEDPSLRCESCADTWLVIDDTTAYVGVDALGPEMGVVSRQHIESKPVVVAGCLDAAFDGGSRNKVEWTASSPWSSVPSVSQLEV